MEYEDIKDQFIAWYASRIGCHENAIIDPLEFALQICCEKTGSIDLEDIPEEVSYTPWLEDTEALDYRER